MPDVNKATVDQLSYYSDTRPKVRGVAQDSRPQVMLSTHTEVKELQSAINVTQSHSRLQHQSEHHAGLVPSNSDQSHIITVLERQHEITALLVQQQSLSFLPRREIQVFDGDPLHYRTFIAAFEHNIEEKTDNPKDYLYFLEQYTRGQPRELVRSCQNMANDRGYAKAKALLQEHFGNAQKIACAYMERALSWPSIKSEDVGALQAYSLFLRGFCNAMDEVEYMYELNMPANMFTVVKKLPYKHRDRWRTVACELQEKRGQRATFTGIVDFIEKQVKIASDLLFGDIQAAPSITANKDGKKFKLQPRSRAKGSSFATTIATVKRKLEHGPGIKVKEKGSHGVRACLF